MIVVIVCITLNIVTLTQTQHIYLCIDICHIKLWKYLFAGTG